MSRAFKLALAGVAVVSLTSASIALASSPKSATVSQAHDGETSDDAASPSPAVHLATPVPTPDAETAD